MAKGIIPRHLVTRQLRESVWYEDHDARKASATYKATHNHLVYDLDEKCWICDISQSVLPKGEHMETHHTHVEWALANGMDVDLIVKDFPEMGEPDEPHLRKWLDSEGNMLVLCAEHHRHQLVGIHQITYPIWQAQRWQFKDKPIIPRDA